MISTDFRSDTWIDWLDPIEKLLYIYCFTNDKSSWCWATEIPLKKIWYETWIDRDMVSKILSRFEKEEKVIYCSWYLIVKNFIRRHFSWIDSPDKWSKNNQLKAIEDEISKLPNDVYKKCCGFIIWFDDICNQENKGLARGLQGACFSWRQLVGENRPCTLHRKPCVAGENRLLQARYGRLCIAYL